MQCLRSWQAWWYTYAKQAPLEWSMKMNRKPLIISFIVIAIVSAFQAINLYMDVSNRVTAYCAFAGVGVSLGIALVIAKCSPSHITEMAVVVWGLLMMAALQFATVVLSNDFAFRLRSHVLITLMWKPFPAVYGFPILLAVVFIGATVVMDIATLLLCQLHHGDPFQMRMANSSAAYAFGWIGVAFMQSVRLRGLYDAQQALSAEKALMESIIAMMCDAIIWLSEDGSTVLRADPRFALLVGRNAVGEQLADWLAEEEHGRVQDCVWRAKAAPVLLPTTLVSGAGVRMPVDIFVVGNRNASAAKGVQEKTPAFLIGIRMASAQGTEELGNVGMRQEHATMLARNQADKEEQMAPPEDELQSADLPLPSVPETSATGRIFARVEVDRWLQGTPEDQAAELRSGLERVDALGQNEHWLIRQQDLELEAHNILGSGAFGVVMGGWLHGSPVAVKVASRSNDASVKHLVAIANEIRIFRHVRHPNITLFHGACVEPRLGEVLLVLERIKGPDLCSYVTTHNTDAEVCVRYLLLLDVAAALRYLHGQSPQIVHGDLKGSNVLVEAAVPRAKLVDFGLSRLLTKGAKPLGGSLPWMAPELILWPANRPRPSASADVFSFGRLAYMILACRKPLEGMGKAAIHEMARAGVAHHLPWDEGRPLQRECAVLCKGVLSSVPEQRPGMREVHQEVLAWEAPDLEEGTPATKPAPTARGASAAPPKEGGLAGAMQSFRAALAASPRQAPEPDHVPAGPRQAPQPDQVPGGPRQAPQPDQVPSGPRQAPQPDQVPGGGVGGAAATLVAGQGGVGADAPPAAGRAMRQQRQRPTPAGAEAARTQPPSPIALPSRLCTQNSAKTFMLMDVLRQWNYTVQPDECCLYHAGIAELQRMSRLLSLSDCKPEFAPYEEFQCRSCGILDFEMHEACPVCNASTGRDLSLASIQEELPEPTDCPEGAPAQCSL